MMTAEQLKNSLLQLAMQGKLVEQRSEEGTGEELYKKILLQRNKLIKERKIKREKSLSEFAEDYPFDIPETWKWVRLGEIISFRIGKTPPRASALYWGTDVPWVSIADMIDGSTITKTKERVSVKAIEERFNGQISCKGTLIMSFKLTVGKVSILGIDAVHNEAIISIFPIVDADYVMRNYLKTMLPFLAVFGDSKKAIMGFTLNSTSLNNIPVPLPPLAEQKRIVAKIEELMPFVEQYAAASTKLNTLNNTFPDQMKKSILQEAVQGKLVPQDPSDEPASVLLKKIAEEKKRLVKDGKIKKQQPLPEITEDEIPFDIPSSWEWVRFSDIMNSISTGPFGSMLHKTDYENEGIPIVNPIHMQGGRIIPSSNSLISYNTAERLSSYKLKVGDIVLARRGDIGRSAVVHEAESGWICGTGSFFATPSKGINPDFISLMFTTPYVRQALLGESVGTTMNNLNQTIILSFLFPLPPEKEQERILSAFDNINRVVTGLATFS